MKFLLFASILALCLASQNVEVTNCPNNGALVKCSSKFLSPVCGITYSKGVQKKTTFVNSCIACSTGKSQFVVAAKCEEFSKEAEFCTPESKTANFCTKELLPQCGWFNRSVQCFRAPCATNGSNKCTTCQGENILFTTPGACPSL